MTNGPAQSVVDTMRHMCAQLNEMKSMLSQSDQLYDNLAKNKAALDEVLQQPLVEAEEETLLRNTELDDGFKTGWHGRWWRHDRRQRADDVLARKLKRWMMAEDKDEAGDTQIELLYSLLANLKGRITVLQRMAGFTVSLEMPTTEVGSVLQSKTEFLAMLQAILEKCEAKQEEMEFKHEDTAQKARKSMKSMAGQQSDRDRELKALEEQLQQLRNTPLTDMVTNDPTVKRLVAELEQLRKAVVEKEAELARFRADMARRLEEEMQLEIARLEKALQDLEQSHKTVKAARQRKQQEEEDRQVSMELQLVKGKEIIGVLRDSVGACSNLVGYIKLQQTFITQCVSSLAGLQAEMSTDGSVQVPVIRARILQVAVELYELLIFLIREKELRVVSMETTMESRTMLLEFCVDTQDPNAHKHEQILTELTVMRDQLKADVEAHQTMITNLISQCRAILEAADADAPDAAYDDQVDALRARAPQFFNLLEGRVVTKAVVQPYRQTSTRVTTSRYVASKRLIASPQLSEKPLALMPPPSSPPAADSKVFNTDYADFEQLLLSPDSDPSQRRAKAAPLAGSPAAASPSADDPLAADPKSPRSPGQALSPLKVCKGRRRRMNTQALSPPTPLDFRREDFFVANMLT
eukprot:GGOE01020259.1.p1 GENE.GGOE01020259.1~~GGOE01020259.1.p1  ORF type:complete len:746 (+),score=259.57 GGOE01020259.1:326-2239(+)